jgi:hypothetical protein
MTNAELMNKVLTDDELEIVAGGGRSISRAKRRERAITKVVKGVIKAIEILAKKQPKLTENAA